MSDSESNSSKSTYSESTDSFSDENGENLYGCYENVPVYTETELKQMKSDTEAS